MERYSGKSVLDGVAIGRLYIFRKQECDVKQVAVSDTEAEKKRLSAALDTAKAQLTALYDDAVSTVGEEHAMIFDIHRMLLEDEDYVETAMSVIDDGSNAEFAVSTAMEQFSELFASMDDDYMRARAADIKDISWRVIRILLGISEDGVNSDEPVIVLAEDLTPSETVKMDKTKVLSFVCSKGSANSHTAILSRSMNIPSLVNTAIEITEGLDGKMAVVDGFSGELIVDPSDDVLTDMQKKRAAWLDGIEELNKLKGQDNVTKDGRRVNLYANIGNVNDADSALAADAGGIGLFRSEFLYLGRDDYPTEEEQFTSYRDVLQKMDGRKVIIRTLDIGADKKADYFELDPEENPALGYRAIRICLDRPELFITQLRAIYRASAYGCAAIMFPMIISVDEIRKIKKIVEQVKDELSGEGCAMGDVELGIMVETPAAALISDQLAEEVDFFSIGTNDLTQYTLAVDRQNQKLESICDTSHPAIMKLIEMTVENGHKAGIWVGICGELAANTSLTAAFIDMGVDELSVSPSSVLKVRKAVREI